MKTIVIHPEVIAYHNAAFRQPKPPLNKTVAVCMALLPIVTITAWLGGRWTAAPQVTPAIAPVTPAASRAVPGIPKAGTAPNLAPGAADGAIELQAAVDQQLVKAEFHGNGRDHFIATLSNPGKTAVTVRTSFGQHFESGRNVVVATRSVQAEIAPGQCATFAVPTAATLSGNRVAPAGYRLSAKTSPRIDLLLTSAQDHPELSPAALQTAVLALLENLPLSAVCKFAPAGGDLHSRFNTDAFRVEILDLLSALGALREIGVRDSDLALTIDPQLKVEAMIDPGCRPVAMRYYGISSGNEWNYWKTQLLQGDPGTRHYALYGIARFYPEIALEMLPKWAREKRTTQIFRLTAVQALAETQRSEALPVLASLVNELGRNTELGRAAVNATHLLSATLQKAAQGSPAVAFRGAKVSAPF